MKLYKINELYEDINIGDLVDILCKAQGKSLTVVATGYALSYAQSRISLAAYEFSSGPCGPKSFSVFPYTPIFKRPGEIGSLKFKGQKECKVVTHYRIREKNK